MVSPTLYEQSTEGESLVLSSSDILRPTSQQPTQTSPNPYLKRTSLPFFSVSKGAVISTSPFPARRHASSLIPCIPASSSRTRSLENPAFTPKTTTNCPYFTIKTSLASLIGCTNGAGLALCKSLHGSVYRSNRSLERPRFAVIVQIVNSLDGYEYKYFLPVPLLLGSCQLHRLSFTPLTRSTITTEYTMKFFALAASLASLLTTALAQSQTTDNAFTSPVSGTVIQAGGGVFTITWSPSFASDSASGNVSLALLKGDANNLLLLTTLADSTENDGAYLWDPTTALVPGTDYALRIMDVEGDVNYSHYFAIELCSTCVQASSTYAAAGAISTVSIASSAAMSALGTTASATTTTSSSSIASSAISSVAASVSSVLSSSASVAASSATSTASAAVAATSASASASRSASMTRVSSSATAARSSVAPSASGSSTASSGAGKVGGSLMAGVVALGLYGKVLDSVHAWESFLVLNFNIWKKIVEVLCIALGTCMCSWIPSNT
ncbi:hypothetical protein G7K_3891-t1 [Saitoella complicata NRRL Y-17804]|uniref:Yeast cell wall synthesis Kre9/Knh1-like N-terminal domain-containing protein n=1 Tax=Saitoella complicata (strain BCRC 22490 / CBS 7301 / JCM 7358 / NBRC 10748 / NRRL Y-17804) TaxID=698492 RepID=A0A0E9NIS7_SAICN|nr:hypothetical protein G7K_3891-t1 [Saitoella complicata NRRL Y-17804]